MSQVEAGFSTLLLAVVLLILPMWGAEAMLAGSVAGLVGCLVGYRGRWRRRGWWKVVLPALAAAVAGALVAWVLSRGR